MADGKIKELRDQFHKRIFSELLGQRIRSGNPVFKTTRVTKKTYPVYSCADSDNDTSVTLSNGIVETIKTKLGIAPCSSPPDGGSTGSIFPEIVRQFVEEAFQRLRHIRPGAFTLSTSQSGDGISRFHQYEHIFELEKLIKSNPQLKTTLGQDYLITPDIVISRTLLEDDEINKGQSQKLLYPKDNVALKTSLRKRNYPAGGDILVASISCKWTMRSDRAQNSRTEALNLMRNRKGKTPSIVAVTFEPHPSRLASIAMGTGDIDCTYHGALYELVEAARKENLPDALDMLETLIEGRRLRDISDLPFDLAI